MNDIFYTRLQTGVRRPTTKAFGFSGAADGKRQIGEACSRAQSWAVVYDPSGTLGKNSRFAKMDIYAGVPLGVWLHGTIFEHIHTHSLLYFDQQQKRLRKLKKNSGVGKEFLCRLT